MSRQCAHCGSTDLEAEIDRYFCFVCGGWTDMRGNALPRKPQFLVPHTHLNGAIDG